MSRVGPTEPGEAADAADRAAVEALLGRPTSGDFQVVVRDRAGTPVVIRNHPFLVDGTPMPTTYWLVGREAGRAVSTLESAGGVDRAEREIDPAAIADAHARYAAARQASIPATHDGPRPSGGVGGTRVGVKCLHAHYAWFLAGGDDPVGAWVDRQLRATIVHIAAERTVVTVATAADVAPGHPATAAAPHAAPHVDSHIDLPVGLAAVAAALEGDPPRAESLTNAIGLIADSLDDVARAHPSVLGAATRCTGEWCGPLADVEAGTHVPLPYTIERTDLESLFRALATETEADRAHNPALDPAWTSRIVAACCAAVAVVRTLRLEAIELS